MDITKTVFSVKGIFKRLPKSKQPSIPTMYLFAKGAYTTITLSQVENFEAVVEEDYKKMKKFIEQAKASFK